MIDRSKTALAKEIRQIVRSLNARIVEAHQMEIVVVVSQENGYYFQLSGKPNTVTVEIREEHLL